MALPAKRLGTAGSESNLSVNSRLSDGKRERLLQLKAREDMKDALSQKFKERYGHGAAHRADDEISVASSAIRREVDRFAGTASVTESNLRRLERRLQKKAVPRPARDEDAEDGQSVSGISAYSCGSRMSRRSRSAASLVGESVAGGKRTDFDWGKLDEYACFLHQQDAARQKAGVVQLQRKLRKDLDLQVQEHQKKKVLRREEDKMYYVHQQEELAHWKESEQVKQDEMKRKVMKEKADRDEQLVLERKIKEEEVEKKKAEEQALVSKIVREMELEKKRLERKKVQQREQMMKVFEENMAEQKVREDAKRVQAEKDNEAMKEYNRLLDKLEEERAQELHERVSKQKDLMEKMKESMIEQEKGMGDEDAMRANQQKAEADARYDEAEKRKQERLKQMRFETRDFLFKQMAEKDAKKNHAERLKGLQAAILEVDTQEYNEVEKQKTLDKKARYQEFRGELERQIAFNLSKTETAMSENEMKMNKRLLDLVDSTLDERDRLASPAPQEPEEI